jgi:ABC-type antimicrobial peptide transport system permease subunit
VNFGRVQNLPLLLAALLGGLATVTLLHLLLSSIRRRRRDMAVLKTLGLGPRDLRRTVGYQAVTLALLALVIGLPAGVAVGRQLWIVFAHQLGIQPQPTIRLLPLALLGAGTLVMALLVAVTPAQLAARTRPAAVLRSE